jgi:hypothetical protein
MIFQLMDNKLDCSGVYLPNKFVYGRIPEGLTKTWSWSRHLDGRDIDYAHLWASGRSLNDVCPPHLKERWEKAENLLKSHFRGFRTAKMNLDDVCFFDLVPQKHLQHYYDCKNEITEWVFENIERPANYHFLKETHENLNHVFLELDFNAAEIRTLLALQNIQQPQEDIHEWNIKNVFKKQISRDEAKTKIFAWLYNPESEAIQSDIYNRESLLERYYSGEKVQTPFGRTIAAPVRKALNYLLQSTSSDNTVDRFNKISRYLRGSRSHVTAVVHDSVIIDLHEDDRRMIPHLKQIFEDTKLGKFKVNVSLGKNLGDMKKFEW